MRHGFLAGMILIAFFFGLRMLYEPYVPGDVVQVARTFLGELEHQESSAAFQMTDRSAFKTESQFQERVSSQLGRHLSPGFITRAEFREVRPRQSWGNRLRRIFFSRRVDPEKYQVDFLITETGSGSCVLPFEVRLAMNSSGTWKVVYFQSHAM